MQFPQLSRPQLLVLSLWSAGIVLAKSCGLTQVAVVLAYLLSRREGAVREQLRDASRDGADKGGAKRDDKRRSLELRRCFAPLLRWVVALMPSTCRHLALAMDATTLGQRFTVLSIHVVIQGCALPQELPLMQRHPEPWPKSLDTQSERPTASRPLQKAA